jgi:two-component system, NtrC family, sensor histidine kinase PilS
MPDVTLTEQNTAAKFRWLMVSRIAIASFILGIALFLEIKGNSLSPDIHLPHLYVVIGVTYVLSIAFHFLQNAYKSISLNIYIQALCDVALVAGLVYATGGIRSIYAVFYSLVIIYSVLFLGRRGGLLLASASSIVLGLLFNLEYYGAIKPMYGMEFLEYPYGAGYIFTRLCIYILLFYTIALLASFLVEREKAARTLLAEKETAFDQLDLLHRSIIESVDTGIMTLNMRGHIKSFNAAATKITGFSFREVENRDITKIFPEYTVRMQQWLDEGSKKRGFEMVIMVAPEETKILGCSVSPLLDGKQNRLGDIVIFQDVTSIKDMESAVERSKRMAFIGEMAAGLAHEMRNPLASISGSIQLLKKGLTLSETDRKLMDIILRGKDQLDHFMRDFLVLAKPVLGVRERFDVKETIDDVLESLRMTPDWNPAIEVQTSLSPDSIVYVNRKEMRQVVWNLLMNAVQSMPEGGTLGIETKPMRLGDEDFLLIRVIDSGCGIAENELAKIFEPFYTNKEKGTGLGLAVVSKIVERYQGRIDIESTYGQGSTFNVWLPLTIEE